MGRLVWFGVVALSPFGAIGAVLGVAVLGGAVGYAVGRSHGWQAAQQPAEASSPEAQAAYKAWREESQRTWAQRVASSRSPSA